MMNQNLSCQYVDYILMLVTIKCRKNQFINWIISYKQQRKQKIAYLLQKESINYCRIQTQQTQFIPSVEYLIGKISFNKEPLKSKELTLVSIVGERISIRQEHSFITCEFGSKGNKIKSLYHQRLTETLMLNSSINKSSSFSINKKPPEETQKQPTKYHNLIHNFVQQYRPNNSSKSNEQALFTPIRKSSIKSIEKKNEEKERKRTPMFFGFSSKEEQNQEEINKQEKVSTDLVRTKYTSKPSLQNSINESLLHQEEKSNTHQNSQVQIQEQDPFMKQRQFYEGVMFGEGLEQIEEKQKNGEFVSTFSIEEKPVRNRINSGEKQGLQMIAMGHQNKISSKKTLYRQIRDTDYRKTSKNFFKRSMNSSLSQGYLKPTSREQQKVDSKGTIANTKQSLNSSKQRESRESFFIKTYQLGRQTYNQKAMFRNSKAYLTFANNLDRLQFRYNGGHATTLYNYKLKIKNQSLANLRVKVKCTSPKHYQVKPCSELTLQPLQIRNISIEMKLYPSDLNTITMKHDLSRYKDDKFMILYWTTDSLNEFDDCEGQKILPVSIQETQQERLRNEGYTKNINDLKTKQEIEEKEIQVYKKLISNNNADVRLIDDKIKQIQSVDYNHRYFSTPLFLVFSLVGLAIGFCMG